MGQQCSCFSDSVPRKLMHGTRVSAGEDKGHATALSTDEFKAFLAMKRGKVFSERKPSIFNPDGPPR